MKTFKARGVVLRDVSVGESDKIVTLLLKGRGKLGASARGARKSNSQFLAAAQLFTYSDFVITQGKNYFAITQADVIETFYGLGDSYERLIAASRAAKLCDRVILEQEPCDDILHLLIYSLNALCKDRPPELVEAAFLLKFLQYSGFGPDFETCSLCGKVVTFQDAGKLGQFPAGLHGITCAACAGSANQAIRMWLAESTRQAAVYIVNSDVRNLFSFEAVPQVLVQLSEYGDFMLREHFDTTVNNN
ncbi:MAG: DNA repair protein RecO [Defluviitaleaceae bacterium]|nr:DNA repair protein RecO [Defluviitaleaceae bacterium]